MRWNLWLAQPETERSLKSLLRCAAAAAAFWTMAAGYGVWCTRNTLAATQLFVMTQSNQTSQISRGLPEKRRLALKAGKVKLISSQGAGSAEITEEFADLARIAGAEIRAVQIGDGKQGSTAAQSASTAPSSGAAGANTERTLGGTANPIASASAGVGNGSQEAFECNIAGEYPSLTHFLSGLAVSHHILDVTSLQITQNGAKVGSGAVRLEMKINGIVYETSEKS